MCRARLTAAGEVGASPTVMLLKQKAAKLSTADADWQEKDQSYGTHMMERKFGQATGCIEVHAYPRNALHMKTLVNNE